ncbi:Uncharacterised protein [Legionella wadsworthii]|uniref:Uncharacterized protein n=1 Tax=Legionella wadsworthii TaxID=28088 RepID=A0A378LUR7_9GAMM|nr:hypothetical protein [Legionella wadsworthii]STY31045.1 Uncharacterised protein [Legionella wadsworthii]
MNAFIHQLVVIFVIIASPFVYSSSLAPVEITFDPNKPIILTNTNKQILSLLCELHLVSTVNNSISIYVLNGKGSFNGTTFKQGDFSVWTLSNFQQIPVMAYPGTKAQVTNLGTRQVKAVCI